MVGIWLAGTGCKTPMDRLPKHEAAMRAEWRADVRRILTREEQTVDWAEGVRLLEARNLELRRTRNDITNTVENVRQVFKDLIPNLNLRTGVSKRVAELSTFSAQDLTFSADGLINVPGFVGFAARLYGAKLGQLRAETSLALLSRQKVAELYKVFHQHQQVQESASALQALRALALDIANQTPGAAAGEMRNLDDALRGLDKAREVVNLKLGDLLGDATKRWVLTTNGLPRLDYFEFELTEDARLGQLQSRFVAIEMEGARARLAGIKLRYWPELYFSIYGPPLYQRYAASERFWDAADIRLSADVYWQLDTRGQIASQLRQTARQDALQMEQLRRDSRAQIAKLLAAQRAIREVRKELANLEMEERMLSTVGTAITGKSLADVVSAARTNWERRKDLEGQVTELETLFWFVDDAKWGPLPGSPPAAKVEAKAEIPPGQAVDQPTKTESGK